MILSESDLVNVARIRLPKVSEAVQDSVWVSVTLDRDTRKWLNTHLKYANVKFNKVSEAWEYDHYELSNSQISISTVVNVPTLVVLYAEWRREGYGETLTEFLANIKGADGRDGGSTVDAYKEELANGVVNGVNPFFTSSFEFVPETLSVFVNGLKMRSVFDYTTTGTNTIQFLVSPEVGDVISLQYFKI